MLKLPLTLAIIQVVVARAGGETFAIPLDVVQRVLAIPPREIELIGDREVCVVRGKHVPLDPARARARARRRRATAPSSSSSSSSTAAARYALVCDQLLGKREIVIKSLGQLLASVPCVAGATLLGDRVALILDVPAIIARALAQPARPRAAPPRRDRRARRGAHILLVEDSRHRARVAAPAARRRRLRRHRRGRRRARPRARRSRGASTWSRPTW